MTIVYGDGYLINYDTIDRLWVGEHNFNGELFPALCMEIHNKKKVLFFCKDASYIQDCFKAIRTAVVHGNSYCELPVTPDDGSKVIWC